MNVHVHVLVLEGVDTFDSTRPHDLGATWHIRGLNRLSAMPPRLVREGTVEEQCVIMMPDGCGKLVELKPISTERLLAR